MKEIEKSHEEPGVLTRLETAKDVFSKSVLQNDTIYAAVKARSDLLAEVESYGELDDFRVEPWLPPSEVDPGWQAHGLIIEHSSSIISAETPPRIIRTALQARLPIVHTSLRFGKSVADRKELGKGISSDSAYEAAQHFWSAYVDFAQEFGCDEYGKGSEDIKVDPIEHVFIPRIGKMVVMHQQGISRGMRLAIYSLAE